MKKIAFALVAFLTAALSTGAAEISEQTKSVLTSIEKANESITTISSAVTEIRTMPNGKQFVSKGVFNFSAPNLLSIHYSDPEGDYLVINAEQVAQKKKHGRSFKVSLKRNETVRALSSTLLLGLRGKLISLAEENEATVTVSEAGGVLNVIFKAEIKKGRDYKQIELSYDKATMQIQSMSLTDKNNVVTKYTLEKSQYGIEIDPALFEI